MAQDRLRLTGDGEVWLTLRHRWSDGTTHLRFDAMELLERLAALTPRPRVNLILYRGVLAPRAAWRSAVVAHGASDDDGEAALTGTLANAGDGPGRGPRRASGRLWADLMRRTFGFDVLACPRCGGRLRLIALIEQAGVIQRILRHLGLPTEVPAPRPARAPPIVKTRDLHWGPDVSASIPARDLRFLLVTSLQSRHVRVCLLAAHALSEKLVRR